MLLKVAALFLVGMVVVAMVGRFRTGKRPKFLKAPGRCPDCNRFLIGKGPCDCKKTPGK